MTKVDEPVGNLSRSLPRSPLSKPLSTSTSPSASAPDGWPTALPSARAETAAAVRTRAWGRERRGGSRCGLRRWRDRCRVSRAFLARPRGTRAERRGSSVTWSDASPSRTYGRAEWGRKFIVHPSPSERETTSGPKLTWSACIPMPWPGRYSLTTHRSGRRPSKYAARRWALTSVQRGNGGAGSRVGAAKPCGAALWRNCNGSGGNGGARRLRHCGTAACSLMG